MKKLAVIAVLAILLTNNLHAQNKQQTDNLATLAKLWGFLKYYHPEAAKGNPDWDKELTRMIPLVKSAPSRESFNKLMVDWYYSLPKAKLADKITQPKNDTIERIFDETDIARFAIPESLSSELTRLYLYHLPDSSKYITDHEQQYPLDHTKHTEDPFSSPALPDEEHRLLALFRYWNIIEFFYPPKKVNAPNWDKVLADFIPKFMASKDTTSYRKTFLLLTARLKDSHSFFYHPVWSKLHNYMNVPFQLTYIDGKYYVGESRIDSLMKLMDLRVGDEIAGINGKPVTDRINELRSYTTGTNELSVYRNIGLALFKKDTNRLMQIEINRQGKLIDKTITLIPQNEFSKMHLDRLPLWEDLGNGVWLVRICRIGKADTLRKLFADIQQAKTVIWDLRGYPNWFVSQAAKRGLFTDNPLCHKTSNSILAFPGSFTRHTWPVIDMSAEDTLHLPVYKGRMIILVNEYTQSLSESCAYELRFRNNTIVMGRQTAGTTGNVTWVDYPGGIAASFTAVGMGALQDRFVEGPGVKIDKEIKLNPGNLVKYSDYILEMARQEALKESW